MAAAGAKGDVPETMADGLKELLPDIALCMAAPDADIAFLDKLQKVVLLKLHQPSGGQGGPGGAGAGGAGTPAAGAGPASPGGMPPSPGGGGPPPGMAPPGGPPGGGAANGQMPNQGGPAAPPMMGGVGRPYTPDPDEMRRIAAESAGE